jgi:2,4-dienoyl-CoA reductase-like NADH-dependent reductase (Old Yellow Enzyme family)/thioredoxin reductase
MFEKLFEPLTVGPVRLKNRLQLLPHNTLYDMLTLTSYLERRARGGVGLVEVSMATAIRDLGEFPEGSLDGWPYKGYDERIVPYYSQLCEAIHHHGAKAFMELSAAGGNRSAARSASSIPGGIKRVTPRAYDAEGIRSLVDDHVRAARHIASGGFDGIDLHATHGMLLEEFYSSATNRREDGYGGSVANRVRLISEIISGIREETGGRLAVGMRIDAGDGFPGGNSLADEVGVAVALRGALDFLNVDTGFEHQRMHLAIAPMYEAPGYLLEAAGAFKRALPEAVIGAAGRIVDPVMAESILEDGIADLVGMTRALIADPDLPNKAREGRLDQIRFCLGDNQKCIGSMLRNMPMRCTVNPLVGRESEANLEPLPHAGVRKKVLVVGAGVAGLEAARTAASRGHEVVVYEGSSVLGGQVNLARKLPGRDDFGIVMRWYESQLRHLGVRVEYRREIGSAEAADFVLAEERPDSVVIATGSRPITDGMQQFDYSTIKGHELALTVDQVLSGAEVGGDVLILDESGFVDGLSLSEMLAKRGSKVELVTRDPAPGLETQWSLQLPYLYERSLRAGVVFTPNTFIREIGLDSVSLFNVYTGDAISRRGQITVILNTGRIPNDSPYSLFRGKVGSLLTVGDCNLARREMGEVIAEAFELTRSI